MLPIIVINLFIGYVGRGFIDNAAHLGGLLSGAAFAAAVEYRRPGERRGVAVAWRALQVLTLALVALGFVQAARNFHRSIQLATVHPVTLSDQSQVFLHYAATMNAVREKVDAVIKNHDLSNVGEVSQQALQVPAPDAQAVELRNRLLAILSSVASAAASASPSPGDGPRRPVAIDPKLVTEYEQWSAEYEEWMKGAVQAYTSVKSN